MEHSKMSNQEFWGKKFPSQKSPGSNHQRPTPFFGSFSRCRCGSVFGRKCSSSSDGKIHQAQDDEMGMGQNPIPLVNIKIAGKWMFIPLKMVCIGIDP